MKKTLSVLAVVCAVLGIPLAGLVFLAGGMSTVPKLEFEELIVGLSLVALSVFFGGIVIVRCRRAKLNIPKLVLASVLGSSLAALLLVMTYLNYR